MPSFDKFHRHCTKCKKGSPCGGYHVYAMELDKQVIDNRSFKEVNPDYKNGMPCVYVGRTAHHPRCRQSQHNNCKVGDWEGKVWTCYCGKKSETKNQCEIRNRSSMKVDKYMTGYMTGSLFRKYNPQIDSEQNKIAEQRLCDDLRKAGFGVWAGHLDSNSNRPTRKRL